MSIRIVVGKAEANAKTARNLAEEAAKDLQRQLDAVGGTVVTLTSVLDTFGLSLVAAVEGAVPVEEPAKEEEAPEPEPTPEEVAPSHQRERKVEVKLKKGGRR